MHRNSDDPSCLVVASAQYYKAFLKHFGRSPHGNESPFTLKSGKVLKHSTLADIPKKTAVSCGVPGSRVATHSLRKGGASCYSLRIAAESNITELDIQRFGTWSSDGYKEYITSHANMMQSGDANPALLVPRSERN